MKDVPLSTTCYLIPFIVFYLIWEKRNRLVNLPSVSSWWGMLPFGAGIVFFWLGELGGEYLTLYISFWLVMVGLCWMHLGWEKLKAIGFAFILILTMFPLPSFLYNKISDKSPEKRECQNVTDVPKASPKASPGILYLKEGSRFKVQGSKRQEAGRLESAWKME
ncbi:MAG: archaeosortase/exosortase family protein [Proteobacteria bacterium]|nr:archaeosortase/exosortase family protein [Pseudomonadota bacterium]